MSIQARLTIAVFILAFMPVCASASEAPDPFPAGLKIELRSAHFQYREPGTMKEEGFVNGLGVDYSRLFGKWLGMLELELLGGVTDYDGSDLFTGASVKSETDTWIGQARLLAGPILSGGGWSLVPYAGVGYRYWYDSLNAGRHIRYLYSPLGAEARTSQGRHAFGVRAEYDIFWKGWVTSEFDDARLDDRLDNDQDHGYGMRASMFWEWRWTESMVVTMDFFFRYWNIEESDTTQGKYGSGTATFVEPANQTRLIGGSLGLRF